MSSPPEDNFKIDVSAPGSAGSSSARKHSTRSSSADQEGTSGKAIASLVLGLLSFCFSILAGIPAIFCGLQGLRQIKRSDGRVTGKGLAITGIVTGVLGCAVTCLVVGLFFLQVRNTGKSHNQMLQMALAMHNFESAFGRLPSAGPDPKRSKPQSQLSWRVQILPYVEQVSLYDKFKHDEPWDSPHNLALVDEMPPIFKSHGNRLPSGKTLFVVPVGKVDENGQLQRPSPAFGYGKGPRFGNIQDGTKSTIMIMEVNPDAAVTWTKPEDWEFDPDHPMQSLGRARWGSILVAMMNGDIYQLPITMDSNEFKALITCNGGEKQPGISRARRTSRSR